MATSRIRNKIRVIIEGYSLYLKFRVLGVSALTASERKRLVATGLVRKSDLSAPTVTDIYLKSHLDLLRQPQSRKQIRDYALKHIHSTAGDLIDKFTEKAVTDLTQSVAVKLIDHRNQMIAYTREDLAAGAGKKTNREIARLLREKTGDLFKDWDRVVTTELAQATNLGAFDAIVENNRSKSPSDIYVYKSGPHDDKTCKHCLRFWFLSDGITPKVYRLSDLLANGANYGRKAADWKPTIGVTHPNERHFLLELPKGWGFKGGAISFVSRDHNEWKSQQGS